MEIRKKRDVGQKMERERYRGCEPCDNIPWKRGVRNRPTDLLVGQLSGITSVGEERVRRRYSETNCKTLNINDFLNALNVIHTLIGMNKFCNKQN